jgi:glyoxalase family protein
MELGGLHHVTAVTAHAARNLAFYTRTLGMRLVKRTVNQDDVTAYHLFYGDAVGHAGSDLTFFDWPYAAERQHGPGTVVRTVLRVTGRAALEWWSERLSRDGIPHDPITELNGRAILPFADFEGQALAFVDDGGEGEGTPWTQTDVPPTHGVRGLGPVLLAAPALEPTARLLRDILNFREAGTYEVPTARGDNASGASLPVHVFATGPGGASAEVHVVVDSVSPRGRVGRGGVHHVAFRTASSEEHEAWHERLASARIGVTPVIDRYYFRSLYFREPGGVLFEIATDGPGFAVDESIDQLGEHLSLPPFLEPRRAEIEASLTPLN